MVSLGLGATLGGLVNSMELLSRDYAGPFVAPARGGHYLSSVSIASAGLTQGRYWPRLAKNRVARSTIIVVGAFLSRIPANGITNKGGRVSVNCRRRAG